jgi:FkbH-like protein
VRVAVLANHTVGAFEHFLRACLAGGGLTADLEVGAYGSFDMALATGTLPQGADGELAVLLLDETYFLPGDWDSADTASLVADIDRRAGELCELVQRCAAGNPATIVLHTVPLPSTVRDTLISWQARTALSAAWFRLNLRLLELAVGDPRIRTVDLVSLLGDLPAPARDDRLHHYADHAYSDDVLLRLAHEIRRIAQARAGLSRKVLALDLDNTLWGGVLGEVGAGGLEIGGLYPGKSFGLLQRTVRQLRRQGVVLVLASKNDPEPVRQAFDTHPEMVLRHDDFSAVAVNWSAKAGNLRQAADSLGLGVQSFAFMDDSDFERGHVAAELPETAVISAAGDPAHLVRRLLSPGWFDTLELTETDHQRPELYRSRAMRGAFVSGFGSTEEYLRELGIRCAVEPVTELSAARVAQLAARTNQFNLTGIRYDRAATTTMAADPGRLVVSVAVTDRFGDDGIVGAAWVDCGSTAWTVRNLVLSCRVLGRGIELAVAAWLAQQARAAGAAELVGHFVAGPKNSVAADFWSRAGFEVAGDGRYVRDLTGPAQQAPEWISMTERSDVP